MEAQEKTFKAQQEALDNIQQMLAQLLNNWDNDVPPVIIMTRRRTPTQNPIRLKTQREVSRLMSMLSKAFKLRLHP